MVMIFLTMVLFVIVAFFALTGVIYWFNLDTKAVKLIEKPLKKYYDNIKRDRRI